MPLGVDLPEIIIQVSKNANFTRTFSLCRVMLKDRTVSCSIQSDVRPFAIDYQKKWIYALIGL